MLYERKEMLFNTGDGENFDKLLKKAKRIKNDSTDYIINPEETKRMMFTEDGTLIFTPDGFNDKIETNLGRTAFCQLCNKIKVPVRYMDNCISIGKNFLVKDNINTWIKEIDTNNNGVFARIYKENNMRGFLSTSYSVFDSDEILDVVANTVDLNKYNLKGQLLNEERLHLRFVGKKPIGLENDKDIFTGFVIDSSDVGRNTLTVRFFIFKQICTNGLIVTKTNDRLLHQIHRGISKDKFQESFINAMDRIDELSLEAIDMINKADKNKIPSFDDYDKYEKFVDNIHNKTQIPAEIIDKAIDIMDEKYNNSAWGLINGITELAQTKRFENRIELETLASNLLTIKSFN